MSQQWWVHLGFQPDSAYIGQVWDNIKGTSIASSTYRFLQYALAQDSSGKYPAWFNFNTGDQLYFFIWNLAGSSSLWSPTELYMCCSDINTAAPYDPTTYLKRVTDEDDSGTPSWGFNHNTFQTTKFESPYKSSKCPWGGSPPCQMTIGGIEFNESVTCKLSFYLTAADNTGDSQIFISDPEVIVSSNGKSA